MTATPNSTIPALVVSGFLGAGKTTLVRHLLQDAQRTGTRVAVVTNEFGALGIDRSLLGAGGEAYVELEGGCVCCELSDDLVRTLQQLWEDVRPDQIIVETSGVALPFDTQLNFWREPVAQWIGDDMAIVVVDAEQVSEQRDLAGTFEDQVSSADLLVVNKTDLIARERLAEIDATLRVLEPETPIVHVAQGAIDPRLLFPPEAFDSRAARRERRETPMHSHERFASEEMQVIEGIQEAELIDRLHELQALRAKGYASTDAGLRLVQVVGRRVELTVPATAPPADLIGRIVVIRRDDG